MYYSLIKQIRQCVCIHSILILFTGIRVRHMLNLIWCCEKQVRGNKLKTMPCWFFPDIQRIWIVLSLSLKCDCHIFIALQWTFLNVIISVFHLLLKSDWGFTHQYKSFAKSCSVTKAVLLGSSAFMDSYYFSHTFLLNLQGFSDWIPKEEKWEEKESSSRTYPEVERGKEKDTRKGTIDLLQLDRVQQACLLQLDRG